MLNGMRECFFTSFEMSEIMSLGQLSISWPSHLFRRDMEYPAEPFGGHGIALFHQLNGIGECFFTSFEMSEKMRVPFTEVCGSFTFKGWLLLFFAILSALRL